jgi:CRISPR-associated Csx11 family protein
VADLLDLLEKYREAILLGEFGALIHMLGKASSEFLKAYSAEAGPKDTHQDLKHLPKVTPKLETSALRDRFTFTVDGAPATLSGDFADFITKYKGSAPDSHLLKLFNTCHRMTSADEKGVVRHKQSIASMRITTPFGRVVRCVSPSEVDKLREKMDAALAEALEGYLQGSSKIVEFRARAIAILKPALSETLGETREPANDVTLWAQSYGVASLYKSCLTTLALGKNPCPKRSADWEYDNVRWRLLGIGWNGLGFVERGRRAADILRRQEIIDDLRETLRNLVEVEYPLGNLFYQDLNGAFFTFPGIEDEPACDLVKELASIIVEKARKLSDNELWPFFTLSGRRRTLTAIAGEITARDRLGASPCIAPLLSIKAGESRTEVLVEKGPSLPAPAATDDICPVCRFRSKAVTDDTCGTCSQRRRGRQDTWRKNQQDETIWIDEIADANGRVALLTLRFDLSRWLSGEWLTTVFSQTYSEWATAKQLQSSAKRLKEFVDKGQIQLPDGSPIAAAHGLAAWIVQNQNRTECKPALEAFLEDGEISSAPMTFGEIADLYGTVDDNTLLSYFFTQNPSPGRLTRIWEATQDFLACLRSAIASDVFKSRPGRLSLQTAAAVPRAQPGETYAIEVPSLNGGSLAVLCLDGTRFLTIDSLDRFTLAKGGQTLNGRDAVDQALRDRRIQSWRRETDGVQIAQEISVANVACGGSYLPFTVLARSPVFYQVLLPARSVPQVLHKILLLGEDHFGKVRGKLPLHVGLLVANRRFPLYALVEAGQQILGYPDLRRGWLQYSWWESDPTDDFFGSYPTKEPDDHGFPIANLLPVERDKQFWITPGFFDFDFLGATTDRHRLRYEAGAPPTRTAIKHGWLCPRPMPLHRLKQLLGIWKLLSEDLTTTQRHQIDAALGTKLEQWRSQGEEARPVFHNFAKTILQDAFGRAWFESLNSDQRGQLLSAADDGLLMDAMELFQHVLKGGGENE